MVPPRLLMCGKHWCMVPATIQHAVLTLYRPSQERDKNPSKEYLVAMHAAIDAVAERERAALQV